MTNQRAGVCNGEISEPKPVSVRGSSVALPATHVSQRRTESEPVLRTASCRLWSIGHGPSANSTMTASGALPATTAGRYLPRISTYTLDPVFLRPAPRHCTGFSW